MSKILKKESKKDLILVTGASGFVATFIVKHLLEEGYRVRGTVRSLENPSKVDHLKTLTNSKNNLELVEADLLNTECWNKAVAGCDYAIHVASPFPYKPPKDLDEILKPAVNGTLTVLQACSNAGIKRVVLTSSIVAVYDASIDLPKKVENKTFNEEYWTDVENPYLDIYAKSKTLAEKAAWDFIKNLPANKKMELATINPGLVLGPLEGKIVPTSIKVIEKIMIRESPALVHLLLPITDVRDVAKAHLKALITPEAVNRRHLIVTGSFWLKDVALILKKEFDPLGFNIATMVAPKFIAWLGSWFEEPIRLIYPRLDREYYYDTKRMREVLKITPTDHKKTILDTAYKLVELGIVKGKAK